MRPRARGKDQSATPRVAATVSNLTLYVSGLTHLRPLRIATVKFLLPPPVPRPRPPPFRPRSALVATSPQLTISFNSYGDSGAGGLLPRPHHAQRPGPSSAGQLAASAWRIAIVIFIAGRQRRAELQAQRGFWGTHIWGKWAMAGTKRRLRSSTEVCRH